MTRLLRFFRRRRKPLRVWMLPWRTHAGYYTIAAAIYAASSKTGKRP